MLACRVVALVTNVPGPIAAARFASLGAQVVKVEPPAGDPLAAAAPGWYADLTAGLNVQRLDLRHEGGRSELEGLLETADLLITSMRGHALRRSGLTWPELQARFPRLCHIAIVGHGAPNDDLAGHDLTYQAQSGLLAPPAMPRTLYADLFAAERAVAAALAALLERERTGTGSRTEIAIAAGAAILGGPLRFGLTAQHGPLGGASPLYRLYRARDGWIALAALEAHFRERLPAALGVQSLDAQTLERRFAQEPCVHWERVANEFDVPISRVNSIKEQE